MSILLSLLIIGFVGLAIYWSFKSQKVVTEKVGYNYLIAFKGVSPEPDLSANETFVKEARIISKTKGRYSIQSKRSAKDLQGMLEEAYQLSPEAVNVKPARLFGGIFLG